MRPELPADFGGAGFARPRCSACARAAITAWSRRRRPHGRGHDRDRAPAPRGGQYARFPAEGFAVDPDLADPTRVLTAAFGDLAAPLIADGVLRYYLLHTALSQLDQALSNLGFGRNSAYAIQPAAARRGFSAIAVRAAGPELLETVTRLALTELQHRSAPPMFAPRHDRPLADLAAEHRALQEGGAVHLLASLDGHDVGLLTIELTSPVPRLCPDGQPYIGPTATLPAARGKGVGHALVDAALTWAHDHSYQQISVDFDTANPLSRPFWLSTGFHPTGYGMLRFIDGTTPGPAGNPPESANGS